MKVCKMCNKELPKTSEFFAGRTDRKEGTLQINCRKCQSEYRKKHYQQNKKKYIDKARSYNKKVADWFQEYKESLSCEICGESRSWVLDFHHKDSSTKDKDLSKLKHSGSKKKILKELSKCIVVCSNCHRDIHYKERNAEIV